MTAANWQARAGCRDEDPELFFPVGTGEAAQRQAAEAKSVCASCPVTEQCLSAALERGEDAGVWGGLDEHERRELRLHQLRHDSSGRASRSSAAREADRVVEVQQRAATSASTAVDVAMSTRGGGVPRPRQTADSTRELTASAARSRESARDHELGGTADRTNAAENGASGLDAQHGTPVPDPAAAAVRRAGEAVSRVQRAPSITARAVEDADLLDRWQHRDHSDELVENQAAEAGVLGAGRCDVLAVDAR